MAGPTNGQRMPLTILIADDHDLIRDGLKPFLEELQEDVEILDAGTYDDVLAAMGSAAELDLILLDLNMPGMAGPQSVKEIIGKSQDTKVVILSGQFERHDSE